MGGAAGHNTRERESAAATLPGERPASTPARHGRRAVGARRDPGRRIEQAGSGHSDPWENGPPGAGRVAGRPGGWGGGGGFVGLERAETGGPSPSGTVHHRP